MNNTQRTYFVKRVKDIHARRRNKIGEHFRDVRADIKSEKARLNDWYANASAKEIQTAAHDLLSTMMEWINTRASWECDFKFPSVEGAIEKDCAMPILAKIVLDHKKDLDAVNEQEERCYKIENARMEKLIDSVMFGGDAEQLTKLLQKYQDQKLPFKD